jgi:hypothetical protein
MVASKADAAIRDFSALRTFRRGTAQDKRFL